MYPLEAMTKLYRKSRRLTTSGHGLKLSSIFFMGLLNFLASSLLRANNDSPQQACHVSMRVTYAYDYLLYLPREYDRWSEKRWPLLLFLHGLGERGNDIEMIKRHGLPRLIEDGRHYPFVIVSPQCPDDEWWDVLALEALLARLIEKYNVDENRVVVVGMSMGGYGTWALAQRHPERYAAIVPICGGGEIRHAAAMRDLPVWAFHGAKDTVVPLKRSQEMIDGIVAAGGRPRLTVYPEVEHNAWDAALSYPELWSWLLAQRRMAPDPATPTEPNL